MRERLIRFVIWLLSAHCVAQYDDGWDNLKEDEEDMLYYANGGPGTATRLLRVNAPGDGDWYTWRRAPAESWQPKGGWKPYSNAQMEIQETGEYSMIDESRVPEVQQHMTDQHNKFH